MGKIIHLFGENKDQASGKPEEFEKEKNLEDQAQNEKALLDSFFGSILPANQALENDFISQASTDSLKILNVDEYPDLPVSEEVEEKIKGLQRISNSIEKRNSAIDLAVIEELMGFKINYKQALNPQQLAAVAITEKPLLVIAGAGSGKTRVIVHRVAYLIEKGVDPKAILLLTFTRKASKEMLTRVEQLLQNKNVANVAGGTFHSFAANILRKYANMIQLPANFSIIDVADAEDIIDLIRTEFKYHQKSKKFPKKSRIQDIFSYARNKKCSIADIVNLQYTGLKEYISDLELIYRAFTKYKQASKILDFDDLMEVLRDRLINNTRFRERLQDEFQYIMVDEFQDTNLVQKDIVDALAAKHKHLMVVGDDSQSIYAFRGANYENILRFPETYSDCVVVKIEQNYRSTPQILSFTNSIVEHAKIGYRKELFSALNNKALPVAKRCFDQEEEAVFIVDRILEMRENGINLDQIAILNRADWHNRYIQTQLSKRGIPYVVVGGFRFNERMHVKDIISYLRLTHNPSDAVSWHRVLKYIGGVGKLTAVGIVTEIQNNNGGLSFNSYQKKMFYQELLTLGKMLATAAQPEYTLAQKVELIKDYYAPLLKAREDDYFERMQDIEVLYDLSKRYSNIDRFLSDFALDPPSKRVADQSTPLVDEGEESGKITLSTVHSAKGLEWYAVFIPHALEGLFPSNRAKNLEEMEEERRLFYVAASRAKEQLYVTFPRQMYTFDAFFHLPSRFLAEIEKDKYLFED